MRLYVISLLLVLTSCSRRSASNPATTNVPTDTSCEFVRVVAHEEPVALIEEFVARDARGEFTKANNWFDGAVDCPGHEPAPDEATMAKSRGVRIVKQGPDSVRAEVTWQRVGRGDAHLSGIEIDTITAIHTTFGWRIASPALNPHAPVPAAP